MFFRVGHCFKPNLTLSHRTLERHWFYQSNVQTVRSTCEREMVKCEQKTIILVWAIHVHRVIVPTGGYVTRREGKPHNRWRQSQVTTTLERTLTALLFNALQLVMVFN